MKKVRRSADPRTGGRKTSSESASQSREAFLSVRATVCQELLRDVRRLRDGLAARSLPRISDCCARQSDLCDEPTETRGDGLRKVESLSCNHFNLHRVTGCGSLLRARSWPQ